MNINSLDLLYEDEHLLVINKPAGMRTIPDGYQPNLPNLHHILTERYGRLWVVHRLDRETSGVLLFARDAETHRWLNQQFQNREVNKEYHLLAIGKAITTSIEIDYPLRVNGDRAHRTIIDMKGGKPALTLIRPIQSFKNDILLIEAHPKTGYTHQIRAHLSAAGYWLLNDTLYYPWDLPPGEDKARPRLPEHYREICRTLPIQRIALHCRAIQFFHPGLKRSCEFAAPYPDDFKSTIGQLKNEGGF